MEIIGQKPTDLLQLVRVRFEKDQGKPGPEDEELLGDLRARGFKITETHKGEQFADTVDESGFKGLEFGDRLQLSVLALAAENYYFGVLIEDPFDKEAADIGLVGPAAIAHATTRRLEFQSTMLKGKNPAYFRMEARSKFRLATITGLWSCLAGIRDRLESFGIDTPEAKRLLALADQLPHIESLQNESPFKYTNMTHEQKTTVVEKMDAIAGNVLTLLRSLNEEEKTDSPEKNPQ